MSFYLDPISMAFGSATTLMLFAAAYGVTAAIKKEAVRSATRRAERAQEQAERMAESDARTEAFLRSGEVARG